LLAIHQQLKTLNTQHTISTETKTNTSTNTKQPEVQVEHKNKTTMTTSEEEIDLTDIIRNNSTPTLIGITKARREISRQLQSRVCADPQTHDHGHSYIVWIKSDWLKKHQVTSQIIPPTNPGAYMEGTHTNCLKSTKHDN
jgi:hypothetical protein